MRFGSSKRTWRLAALWAAMGLGLLGLVSGLQSQDAAAPTEPPALLWDATEKVLKSLPGEHAAEFQFTVTNVSDRVVSITQLMPTCGCTVAEMPASPWVLEPGATGTFAGTIDFKGKSGLVKKAIHVTSTAGVQTLMIGVEVAQMNDEERRRNQELAQANRQVVFQGDCAKCHLTPAVGKTGGALFMAACGVCHITEHRSSIVPDLLVARTPRDADYWRKWIAEGKEGTLMPAWSKRHGGPLTDEEIDSLVTFALDSLPTAPRGEN